MTSNARCLVLGAVVTFGAMAWPGGAAAQSIYVDYYTPQFYMDRLVFYDEAGSPVYYEGDAAYSVPSSFEGHQDLVAHYQSNADAYYRWFEQVGHANLNFRRPVAAHGYQPLYYLDYPVFFDDAGRPVYYVDGVQEHVPPSYPEYGSYVSHYRMRRGLYLRWYQQAGRHYRWYRRPIAAGPYSPLYFDGYLVFYDGAGEPYYYLGERMVHIPRTHGSYRRFATHYRAHRQHYHRWYNQSGRRYHGYRQPRVFRHRAPAAAAPRAAHGRALHRTYPRRGPVGPGYRGHPGRPPEPGHRGHPGRPPEPGHRGHPGRPPEPGHRGHPGRPPEPGHRGHPGRPPEPGHRGHPGGPPQGQPDCRRNPGHPACRGQGGPPPQPGRRGPEGRPGRPNHPEPRGRPGPGPQPGGHRRHR